MKLIIKDNPPEDVEPKLTLGLMYSGDSIKLVNYNQRGAPEFTILTIHPDGWMYLNKYISPEIGLALDDQMRIKLREY